MEIAPEPVSVRRMLWNGTIPLKIVLAQQERNTLDLIQPYYINAHRLSYLPFLFERVLAFFKPYLRDPESASSYEWWFEFEDVPLRWNWPIGLLYDLLTGLDPALEDIADHDWHLPWSITIHFNDYPADSLLRLTSVKDVEDQWMNRVKESDFIRRGNSNTVMNLSRADSDNMWAAVVKYDFDMFWNTARKLLPQNAISLNHVPVKIYLPSSNKILQSLITPMISPKEVQTVGTALHTQLGYLFPSRRTYILAKPIVHGISVPMSAPLAELLYECMYTDGYLHICIVMIS
ncbi:autophagy protein Apg5-domain-containing protein [Lipomyces oligophaga]|uniref:autophagy protein Apg5-domain-containing protein n=1 Tax=Lipomyces oligophaga TaxID=45792 RepID=UPI0034CDCDDB